MNMCASMLFFYLEHHDLGNQALDEYVCYYAIFEESRTFIAIFALLLKKRAGNDSSGRIACLTHCFDCGPHICLNLISF